MIAIEISPGEFLDRLTILAIKSERLSDPAKRAAVDRALDALLAREAVVFPADRAAALRPLRRRLEAANTAIWEAQERLRQVDWSDDRAFVPLARRAHRQNDERFRIKRDIDRLMGSGLAEEKSYL